MKALIIIGAVAAALLLLSLVRVGGRLSYTEDGLTVKLRLGPFLLTVYPFRSKKKKRNKKAQTAPPPAEARPAAEPERGGSLELLKDLIPVVAEAAGRLKQKVRIDCLDIDLTVAAGDPALTAVAFGGANAVMGMMVPLLENNFNIKERRFRTAVDFNAAGPTAAVRAAFSLTIGQGVVLYFGFGFRALGILLSHKKKKTKQKEAV